MWPLLARFAVPVGIGAVAGGAEAARRGKNPFEIAGAAALGGGLGALVPGASRFAGGLLAETPLAMRAAPAVYRAGQRLAGAPTNLLNPLAQQLAGKASIAKLGAQAAGLGLTAAVPAVAAGLAGAPGAAANAAGLGARSAVDAAGGAAGLARTATFKPEELGGGPQYPSGAAPDISQYGYPGLIQQQNPLGPWQANIQYQRQLQDLENTNIRRLANYQLLASDEVKKRDFQRNAAAAQLSTALATNAQMQLQGQINAGAQAGQALANIGQIAGTQYRYL